MRINEAAERAGVTPKNIRFYEEEGLLHPAREKGNRYRDYSPEDVALIKRIRLLRTLDVPLAEIRAMENGGQSLQTALARHMALLESRRRSLELAAGLCQMLSQSGQTMDTLDADACLAELEEHQRKGVHFMDVKKKDNKNQKRMSAALGAVIFAVMMAFLLGTMVWAFAVDPAGAPPLPIYLFFIIIPASLIIGVFAALYLRFKEIKGGEEDAYRDY